MGVTWRSRGKPGGKLHFLLSQQPVLKPIPSIKVSKYEWHNAHSNQSIMPQFAVEYMLDRQKNSNEVILQYRN